MEVTPISPADSKAFRLLNGYQRAISKTLGPEGYKTYTDCLTEIICPESEETLPSALSTLRSFLRQNRQKWFQHYHTMFSVALNTGEENSKTHVPCRTNEFVREDMWKVQSINIWFLSTDQYRPRIQEEHDFHIQEHSSQVPEDPFEMDENKFVMLDPYQVQNREGQNPNAPWEEICARWLKLKIAGREYRDAIKHLQNEKRMGNSMGQVDEMDVDEDASANAQTGAAANDDDELDRLLNQLSLK